MQDDPKDPTPEPIETPPVVEPETPPEPEAPPAEEPSPEGEPTEPSEEVPEKASAEFKYWQAAYTKSRQKDADEIRQLREDIAELRGAVLATGPGEEPPPPTETGRADVEDSPVDKALRQSKTVRDLQRQLTEAKTFAQKTALQARIEAARARIPGFAKSESAFGTWVRSKPGIAEAIVKGEFSLEEAFYAFAGPQAASARARVPATKPAPRAMPAASRVEGPSAPAGAEKDIRALARERGQHPFDVAVDLARRQLRIASAE